MEENEAVAVQEHQGEGSAGFFPCFQLRARWPLTRGRHVARALVWTLEGSEPKPVGPVGFRVK